MRFFSSPDSFKDRFFRADSEFAIGFCIGICIKRRNYGLKVENGFFCQKLSSPTKTAAQHPGLFREELGKLDQKLEKSATVPAKN